MLNRVRPNRKADPEIQYFLDLLPPDFYGDQTLIAKVIKQLTQSAHHAIDLFASSVGLDFDYTLVNVAASKWASEYSFELIKDIDETTTKALQSIFKQFVETPGMTIGNVIELLPYDEMRSLRIAITEITRTYATAEEIAGKALKEEFPGVKVIKRWFTNNDDRVCPICQPLHNQVVEINEGFSDQGPVAEGVPYPPAHVGCRCWISSTTRLE